MVFSIQKIENLQEFRNLKNAWDGILESKKHYHPFFDHDWFKLWLDHFLRSHQLLTLLFKNQNHDEAICPFLTRKEKFKGIPIKKIELTGNIYSPVRNFILARLSEAEREQFLLELFEYVGTSIEWDLMDLKSLPVEDFDFMSLNKVLNKLGLKSKEYFCFGNWYLDGIDFSGDQYIQARTSNIRENVKRYSRALNRQGKLQFIMVANGKGENIDYYMDLYYRVYHSSWKAPEMDSTFHRDLAKLAYEKGWLRLGLLLFNEIPIASQLWLVSKRVAYIVKLAYDENYGKFRPGIILTSEMMKYVIDVDGVEEIDYLEGDEPYKKDWTPKRRERRGIFIFNNNFKGQFLAFLMIRGVALIERNKRLNRIRKIFSKYLNRIDHR